VCHGRSNRWCHGKEFGVCSAGAADLQVVKHRVVIGGINNHGVRGGPGRPVYEEVTGRVTLHGIRGYRSSLGLAGSNDVCRSD